MPDFERDAMATGEAGGDSRGGRADARDRERVALFGGSFDPPHLGHLAVARAARAALDLDRVLFAPVGMQPLKPEGPAASFEERVEMTRLAIAGEPGFEMSLVDAPRAGTAERVAPNYTVDTLAGLRATLGADVRLFCLMGADAFFALRQWHRAAEIPFVATLVVAWRPGQALEGLKEALPAGLAMEAAAELEQETGGVAMRAFVVRDGAGRRAPFYVLPDLNVEISASEIRAEMQAASVLADAGRAWVPAAVREYILSRGLYRG